jgi:hypothetical protein
MAFSLQFSKRRLARLLILEQPDFPQFLAKQFAVRIAEQPAHERIGVGDS